MAPSAVSPPSSIIGITKPTLYLLDTFHPAAIERARELFTVILPSDPEFTDWQQHAKYLLIRASSLTAAQIESAPHLLAIGKQGVGTDRIDAAACAARGIKIFNTPGVNSGAVAELVLSLTMSLARQIRPISVRIARGEVVRKEECDGLILHKCTLGLVGMGNIGRKVAEIFRGAFQSEIVAFDPYMGAGAWPDLPHKRVTKLEDLLKVSDVVSLHVPLTSETRGLLSYEQLAMMKRSALLINAARGGIVDEADLERALADGLIWGAGLDCHEQEPPTPERYEKLWQHTNVISLPHIGAATSQTQRETATAAVENLYAYVKQREEATVNEVP
ncbi:hypothetical protein PV08_00399 [Exophiala spinifera]|uniref:Phosphoglycerate dehydrogenase n=1 Tax=Exophiala spinifera TaxID=91928 RepID=A0A0D2C8D3_9EURO|nr:uncharacterized protein PV08_00399 [Exophiala spinifera]KIW19824.1 hypothetical protein PV08_00399 [Exophiala spinifera]